MAPLLSAKVLLVQTQNKLLVLKSYKATSYHGERSLTLMAVMWGSLEGKNDKHQGREDTSSSEVYPVMKTQSGRKGGRKQKKKKQLKQFDQLAIQRESEVAQSCLTLCDPRDCSLPGFSVHGIFQARILEWAATGALANKSPGHERSISNQTPSVSILACLAGLSRLLQLRMWLFTASQLWETREA